LAEQTYQRTSQLFSNKYATAQSADEAASNLAVGTAAVELARVQMEKTRIVAPFSGIVGLRHVSVGEYITAGLALVNLEAIDPVKADFRVPEKFLPAIKVGQAIRIRVDAFPGETFNGKVYAIDPRIDVAGRSLLVRAKVPNADQRLRPGLFARVTVLLQLKEDALTIPEQAIVPQGDSQYVFKINDGKATLTKVSVGMRRSGQVEILDGLGVGDEVVTAGQLKLRDGTPVSVINGAGA
jgi:membrane fusion protein (multidrug efflux system)